MQCIFLDYLPIFDLSLKNECGKLIFDENSRTLFTDSNCCEKSMPLIAACENKSKVPENDNAKSSRMQMLCFNRSLLNLNYQGTVHAKFTEKQKLLPSSSEHENNSIGFLVQM